jgi:tetratricopeptide (TPR) repeat protein
MVSDDLRFLARLKDDATNDLLRDVQAGTQARSHNAQPTIWGYQITGPPMYGGMGTVWPAKQLGTQRDVVVKTLVAQQSPVARAMFVREVELSARLQHPNIARVYDSGIHEGQYYYAMELIEGVSLHHFAQQHRLTQRQVLELLRTVCQAVQHAHLRGVIHCDLKPGNILVTPDGQPHVLDFGLARLVTYPEVQTSGAAGATPGTPAYMSPEQAAGRADQIDTRSDVYSLGKMLYELLVGQPAHALDGSLEDLVQRVANQPVRRPRDLAPKLDGELQALLLKALDQNPERRYSSAGELANDIDHFLRREPLSAIPRSTAYLLRKWARKRRVALSGFATILTAIVVMGALWYVHRSAENAKKQVKDELLRFMVEVTNPRNSGGRNVTAELLAGVDQRVSSRFGNQPREQADIFDAAGQSLLALGQFEAAETQFERAVKLREEQFGRRDARTLRALRHLAQAHRERGKLAEAANVIGEVLRALESQRGADVREMLLARVTLAYVFSDLGWGGEAEVPLRAAYDRACQQLGNTDPNTLEVAAALVVVLRDQGDARKRLEARELGEKTLQARRKTLRPDHLDTLQSMQDLAKVLELEGDLDQAIKLCVDSIRIGERALPLLSVPEAGERAYYPDVLVWKADLAAMLHVKGKHDDALKIYQEIYVPSLAYRGDEHPFNVIVRSNYARLLVGRRERLGFAEELYRAVVRVDEKFRGPEDPDTLMHLDALAVVLSLQRRFKDSADIYRRTLDVRKKKLAADDPAVVEGERSLQTVLGFQAREAARGEKPAAPATTRASDPK